MTFGWQGFSLDHPDDWGPVSLSGSFGEGYARLSSSSRLSLQVRWQHSKREPQLDSLLDTYLSRLGRDAKRARAPFTSKCEADGRYHWRGAGQGRGAIFYSAACSRVFFLEVTGDRKDGLLPHVRRIHDTFSSQAGDLNHWAILGLSVHLPSRFVLVSKELKAGLTRLSFHSPGGTLICTRWGFAEQLLREFGLSDWARRSLNMHKATVEEEEQGMRLASRSITGSSEALVAHQPEGNQIVTIQAKFRKGGGPQWDWLR